jgi:hypothetical protein
MNQDLLNKARNFAKDWSLRSWFSKGSQLSNSWLAKGKVAAKNWMALPVVRKLAVKVEKTGLPKKMALLPEYLVLLPGLALLTGAIVLLVWPELISVVIAACFLAFGVAFVLLALQFIRFKRRAFEVLKEFKGGVVVQASAIPEERVTTYFEGDSSKVTVH